MAFFLIVGLVIIAGLFSLLPGAVDVVSTIMSIPDAADVAEVERKARTGR
jgi:hypothetical protein